MYLSGLAILIEASFSLSDVFRSTFVTKSMSEIPHCLCWDSNLQYQATRSIQLNFFGSFVFLLPLKHKRSLNDWTTFLSISQMKQNKIWWLKKSFERWNQRYLIGQGLFFLHSQNYVRLYFEITRFFWFYQVSFC